MVYPLVKNVSIGMFVGVCAIRASELIIFVQGIRHKLGESIMNKNADHALPSNSSNVSVAISTIVCESTFGSRDTISMFLAM